MTKPKYPYKGGNAWENTSTNPIAFTLLIVIQILIIAALATLVTISARNQGVTNLPSTPSSGWALPLLWTSLPPLFFSVFASFWSGTANALRDRQPFADLLKPGGAPVTRTLLLDYRVHFGSFQWVHAFRHGHWMVGASLLLAMILSIAVPALSARLLADQLVPMDSALALDITHQYNKSSITTTDIETIKVIDWKPVIDAGSSVGVFGGSYQPWTDTQNAYARFATDSLDLNVGATLSANTTAYSTYLDCAEVPDLTTELIGEGSIRVSGVDRGCPVSVTESALDFVLFFATSWTMSCGKKNLESRLLFAVGLSSPDLNVRVANISLISCISGYGETNGTLRVRRNDRASGSEAGPEILNFEPLDSPRIATGVDANDWHNEEKNMIQTRTFTVSNRWQTSDFGSLVLYHLLSLNGTVASVIDPRTAVILPSVEDLKVSIDAMFRLIYVTLLSAVFIVPVQAQDKPLVTGGELQSHVSRLVVVSWVAYAILPVLFAGLLCTIGMWVEVRLHPTILTDQPSGLLTHLNILYPTLQNTTGQPLVRLVEDYQNQDAKGEGFAAHVRRRWNVDSALCAATVDNNGQLTLEISGLALKYQVPTASEEKRNEREYRTNIGVA